MAAGWRAKLRVGTLGLVGLVADRAMCRALSLAGGFLLTGRRAKPRVGSFNFKPEAAVGTRDVIEPRQSLGFILVALGIEAWRAKHSATVFEIRRFKDNAASVACVMVNHVACEIHGQT